MYLPRNALQQYGVGDNDNIFGGIISPTLGLLKPDLHSYVGASTRPRRISGMRPADHDVWLPRFIFS
jgi:hypothetical protein